MSADIGSFQSKQFTVKKPNMSHLSAGIHHASAASIGGNSSGGRGLGVGDNSGSVDQTEPAQLP